MPVGFAELLLAYMSILILGRGWSKYVEYKHGTNRSRDVSSDILEADSSSRGSPGDPR